MKTKLLTTLFPLATLGVMGQGKGAINKDGGNFVMYYGYDTTGVKIPSPVSGKNLIPISAKFYIDKDSILYIFVPFNNKLYKFKP